MIDGKNQSIVVAGSLLRDGAMFAIVRALRFVCASFRYVTLYS